MSIRVIKPGLLTTVQDWGRIGSQSIGFNVSGVMDRRSYRLANFGRQLHRRSRFGNDRFGRQFCLLESNYIAITGADMGATIEGVPAPMYQTIFVREGDTLSFSAAKSGMYTYVAFAGGLDVPQVLGSRSTNLKCAVGGFEGRKLKSGDILPFRNTLDHLGDLHIHKLTPEDFSQSEVTLRVIMGPQDDYFTHEGVHTFLHEPYKVTQNADRMGYKLEGEPIAYKDSVDIISDGIVFGSIQVPRRGSRL